MIVSYKNTKEDWQKKNCEKATYASLTKFKMVRSVRIMPQKNTGMRRLDKIKKLKKHLEELKFVKDFQQDTI
jgi:hypothetical protein